MERVACLPCLLRVVGLKMARDEDSYWLAEGEERTVDSAPGGAENNWGCYSAFVSELPHSPPPDSHVPMFPYCRMP